MASERKVVLLIVEGSSDSKALKKGINDYFRFKGLFSAVECEVYSTDLTLHPLRDDQRWTGFEEVIGNVKTAVLDFVDASKVKEKIELDQIGYVASLSDLDACYCPDSAVVWGKGPDGRDTYYDVTRKQIFCTDPPFIKARNQKKVDAFGVLHTENKVKVDETHVLPFHAFYCSLNLEHALYNCLDILTEDDKDDAAFRFRQFYTNKPEEFAAFLRSIPCVSTDYQKSWNETILKKY